MITNNVTRLLDSRKITYSVYELPVEKLGAEETARILGVPLEIVFKTIVVLREKPGKPILAVVPGTGEVNLKGVASVLGEKKVHLSTQAEAEKLTGLQAGGISPLALINRGFTVLLDQSALAHEQIHISGGQRGLNIRLAVKALIALTNARTGDICLPTSQSAD
jgi:Cys-tRNA(Pro)/Cys-tRNA(Cys) deacylase